MYKDAYSSFTNQNLEKTNKDTKGFRITKQNLNDINDYILNFQRYYELIKNYPNLRSNKKMKEFDTLSFINLTKKKPYNKLQNDISDIYKRIYTETNDEKINNKYYSLKKNKIIKNSDKINAKYFHIPTDIDMNTNHNIFLNINNKNNIQRTRYEYGNYAINNTNFNHPQLYLLKYNRSCDTRGKLPNISGEGSRLKITRNRDLAYLIPQNTRKAKFRTNFYNYYIGLKNSKHKFNI